MKGQLRVLVGVAGVSIMVLLHSLLFVAAGWGGLDERRFPDRLEAIGAGANIGTPEGDSGERRIIVRLLSEIRPEEPSASPDAHLDELLKEATKLDIAGPSSLPLPPLVVDQEGDPAESTDAEMIARAKLVGVYESQVRARIERAWELPAGSSGEQDYSCRVLIRQYPDGRVRELELPYGQCEVSADARDSLVRAVFTASPLPAPPHPAVFVDSFSLVLHSRAADQARHLPVERQTPAQDYLE